MKAGGRAASSTSSGEEGQGVALTGAAVVAAGVLATQAGFWGFAATLPVALAADSVSSQDIGFIVGLASAAQIATALVIGHVIDARGSRAILIAGGIAYLGAATLIGLGGPVIGVGLVVARVLQGIGIGAIMPAAFAAVGAGRDTRQVGRRLAITAIAHNVAQLLWPLLSLWLLAVAGLPALSAATAAVVLVGVSLWARLPGSTGRHTPEASQPAPVNRVLIPGLLAVLLMMISWGIVLAYLPQRAVLAGTSSGILFATDAVAVALVRLPVGMFVDRASPHPMIVAGLALLAVGMAALIPRPTPETLVLAGLGTGLGSGAISASVLTLLASRTGADRRGRVFGWYSVFQAIGSLIGSAGLAPIAEGYGFPILVVIALCGLVIAAVVILGDWQRSRHPVPSAA